MLLSTIRTALPRLSPAAVAASARFYSTSSHDASHDVSRLSVVGAGQMGLGIALVAARTAQVPVTLIDNSPASLQKAMTFLLRLLEKEISKARLTDSDADAIHARIATTTDLSAAAEADFIIEAVPEIPALKKDLFSRLAELVGSTATLATNTSSISITSIAAAAHGAEDRVVATHFMNPVPVQKGVEIISGLQTSPETLARAIAFVRAMGKIPAVSKDAPGFIANRILMPYINEAVVCLETGVGERDDIDSIMKNGTNVPMGPLQLADFIGLDTCLAIMKVLYEDTADSKYRPATLLKKYVDAGWLGKKSGKGFYEYK